MRRGERPSTDESERYGNQGATTNDPGEGGKRGNELTLEYVNWKYFGHNNMLFEILIKILGGARQRSLISAHMQCVPLEILLFSVVGGQKGHR